MKLAICSAYPGLDPIRLLDYPLADVLDLIVEHLDHNRRADRQQNINTKPQTSGDRERVIYREADDSWF